jgi:flagellar biosynthesis/type III secretory pathway protein FliH
MSISGSLKNISQITQWLLFSNLIFEKNIDTLKTHSKKWYQQISKSRLPASAKKNLQNAFINWLLVRFPKLNYEEVIKMIETLPNIEETLAYQQLVGIGIDQGKKQGIKQGKKQGIKQGKKQGIKQGKKQGIIEGKKETLKREIQRLKKMNKSGELNDDIFKKISAPIQKELKKVTNEINKMLKEMADS